MIHTDRRPTIAMKAGDRLLGSCSCPDFAGPVDTRAKCAVHGPLYAEDADACTCGDPGDCGEC